MTVRAVTWTDDSQGTFYWRPDSVGTDPGAVPAGRRWARGVLLAVVCRMARPEVGDAVDLVITELITNAVRHGGGVCTARMSRVDAMLRVVVCDHSPAAPAMVCHPDASRVNGRGLPLVGTLAERWGFHWPSGRCKCVWADLSLTPARPPYPERVGPLVPREGPPPVPYVERRRRCPVAAPGGADGCGCGC